LLDEIRLSTRRKLSATTGGARIRLVVAPNKEDERQVTRGILCLRLNVLSFFRWLGGAHPDWRSPVPKRPVPGGHSLQILVQPALSAKLLCLAICRCPEGQNDPALDFQHENGWYWRRPFSFHGHIASAVTENHSTPVAIGRVSRFDQRVRYRRLTLGMDVGGAWSD
jgi:hypothetical protein